MAVGLAPASAGAKVNPVGLLLGDASKAAVSAVSSMSLGGSLGAPTVGAKNCKRVSWMAASCKWSVVVTAPDPATPKVCSGTLSMVRQQVSGYPITANRAKGTTVKCTALVLR